MIRLDRRRRPKILLVGHHPESAIKALAAEGFDAELYERLSENLLGPLGGRRPELAVVSDLAGVSALAAASFVQAQLRRPVLSFPRDLQPPVIRSLLHVGVLEAVRHGHATTESIAQETGYSERRVDAILQELQTLLGAASRAETIAKAYALSLIYQSCEAWNDPIGETTES